MEGLPIDESGATEDIIQETEGALERLDPPTRKLKIAIRSALTALSVGLWTPEAQTTSYDRMLGLEVGRAIEYRSEKAREKAMEYQNLSDLEKLEAIYWPGVIDLTVGSRADASIENQSMIQDQEEKSDTDIMGIPLDSISDIRMDGSETGLDNELLLSVLDYNVPREWLENVSSIKQVNETYQSGDHYGLDDNWETIATARDLENGKTEIVLYEPSQTQNSIDNLQTIYHEIGHANDWNSSENLSYDERIDLLLRVTERLESNDRYMSAYVESISNENKIYEKYLKATEYWAEVSGVYMSFGGKESLHIDDLELVRSIIDQEENNENKD